MQNRTVATSSLIVSRIIASQKYVSTGLHYRSMKKVNHQLSRQMEHGSVGKRNKHKVNNILGMYKSVLMTDKPEK